MLASSIVTYQDLLKDIREPIHIRLAMVRRYEETKNISLVAKEFKTTRVTVRKWIRRFNGAMSSLRNVSKAPKNPYRQLSEYTERLLIEFRKKYPSLGYDYIHYYLMENNAKEIPSKASVYAIWHKYGLLRKCYKKYEKKKDLRAIKAKYKPFEKIQIDVKELRDIPNYLEQSLALGIKRQKELPNPYGLQCINILLEI